MPVEIIQTPVEQFDFRGHRQVSDYRRQHGVTTHLSTIPEVGTYAYFSLPGCSNCGAPGEFEPVNDEGIYVATEPCPYPESLSTTIQVAFPSGKIVVADSLWKDSKLPDFEVPISPGYETALGRSIYYKQLAQVGIAYGYVGNTCPRLFITSAGELIIASPAWEQETDEPVVPADWTLLAEITTDLWAYSITDYQNYVAHDGNLDRVTVAEVPAGVYQFTHHADRADFDDDPVGEDVPVVYAQAVLVKSQ